MQPFLEFKSTNVKRESLLNRISAVISDPLSALLPQNHSTNFFTSSQVSPSVHPGFGRAISIDANNPSIAPISSLSGLLLGFFYQEIIDGAYALYGARIARDLEAILKYNAKAMGASWGPRLLKLYNIRVLLDAYKPDAIFELGSGFSSVVLARYQARSHCHYTILEDNLDWANNTLASLSSAGLPSPSLLIPRMVTRRFLDNDIFFHPRLMKFFRLEDHSNKLYASAFVEENWVLDVIKASQRILFLVDGLNSSGFSGAGFLINPAIDAALSSCSSLVLVDGRLDASFVLECHSAWKKNLNTNTQLIIQGDDFTPLVKQLCLSLYSRNVDMEIDSAYYP